MHKNWLQKDVECLKVEEKSLICENSHSDERKNNQQDTQPTVFISRFRFLRSQPDSSSRPTHLKCLSINYIINAYLYPRVLQRVLQFDSALCKYAKWMSVKRNEEK